MAAYRSWQEGNGDDDRFSEIHIVSIFPLEHGFLITMRGHFRDKKPPHLSFGHQEVTFFASFKQANEMAHTLINHIPGELVKAT